MSWQDDAIGFGIDVVKKIFEGKKDDKDLISVGLAVGYFYNFIAVCYDTIQHEGTITLLDKPDDKEYDAEMVEMRIILPTQLNVNVFNRCEAALNKTQKGSILLKKQKRPYGFNYTRREDKAGIAIADLARPLMAVKRFYEDILGYKTHDPTDMKWAKAQLSEVNAFKETLKRLQMRGYGVWPNNRFHFDDIE